jgi:hypothetical protein
LPRELWRRDDKIVVAIDFVDYQMFGEKTLFLFKTRVFLPRNAAEANGRRGIPDPVDKASYYLALRQHDFRLEKIDRKLNKEPLRRLVLTCRECAGAYLPINEVRTAT